MKRILEIWTEEFTIWDVSADFYLHISHNCRVKNSILRNGRPTKVRPQCKAYLHPSMMLCAYAAQRSYMDRYLASTAEENQVFAWICSKGCFLDIKSRLARHRTGRLSENDRLDLIISLYSIDFLLSLPSIYVDHVSGELRSMREHLGRYVLHCLHELTQRATHMEIIHLIYSTQKLIVWKSWDLSETFRELSETEFEEALEKDEDESQPNEELMLCSSKVVQIDEGNPFVAPSVSSL